ncbi:hypothetical protein PL963_P100074 (plasmid) [Pseudomonas cerasi]|uniref:Uncharacterized protein n=1 Tax=Pseudomonas cerasi TaxID=1583341 RepID=A0A2K4W2E6_9PSED|nr:hypothetical protein PL963_P100074 [Pseudomonas cerasi]
MASRMNHLANSENRQNRRAGFAGLTRPAFRQNQGEPTRGELATRTRTGLILSSKRRSTLPLCKVAIFLLEADAMVRIV